MKKKTAAKPLNVAQKIIAAHLVEGDPAKDAELGIRIDQTLTQDATGTMAYLQFESMDVPHVARWPTCSSSRWTCRTCGTSSP